LIVRLSIRSLCMSRPRSGSSSQPPWPAKYGTATARGAAGIEWTA
jgi:hypothetical protein